MSEFRSRIAAPLAVPVLVLVALGILAFLVSRILLAVPTYWSVALAGLIAAEILGICALLAAVQRVTSVQKALISLLGVIVLVGGGIGLAAGIRPIEAHHASVAITAVDIAFDTTELHVPADEEFTLEFVNNDPNIPHNVAIYTDESATEEIFVGRTFNGVETVAYEVPAIPEGTYFFRCDVHPNMAGDVIASATEGEGHGPADDPSGEPPTGDDTPGALTVTARSITFDTDTIEVESGAPVHISFVNEDANIPHNIAVYTDDRFAESIFVGEIFDGVETRVYTFDPPPPGEYAFRCDLHPNMVGTFIVH